jgi:nucleotide-binding universal stress UspA family protein
METVAACHSTPSSGASVKVGARWRPPSEREPDTVGTILCAIDRSTGAEAALVVARTVSEQLGARLVVAHVTPRAETPWATDRVTDVEAWHDAVRLLEDAADKYGLGAHVDRRAEVGDPAERLACIASEEGAALIVLGARARGRRSGKLVSGLAAELIGTSRRPVVVVPPRSR